MADNYDDELELLEINNSTVNIYDYSIMNPSDFSYQEIKTHHTGYRQQLRLDIAILKFVCLLSLSIITLLQLYCVVRIQLMCFILFSN